VTRFCSKALEIGAIVHGFARWSQDSREPFFPLVAVREADERESRDGLVFR